MEIVDLIARGELKRADDLLLNESGYLARCRRAIVGVLRLVYSGDRNLADESIERLDGAIDECSKAEPGLKSEYTSLSEKRRSFFQVISLQAKFSHPWCDGTESNAGEVLGTWRDVVGMQSLMYLLKGFAQFGKHAYVKGALSLRSGWLLCRHVGNTPVEGCGDHTARMVKGIYLFALSNMPPFLQTVFKVIGFESDRELGLEMLRSCSEEGVEYEARTFSTIFVALHHLLMSQQEYKQDIKEHMNKAEDVIESELARDPESMLARLVKSHVIRRQGQTEHAMVIIDSITPQIVSEIEAIGRDDVHAYRIMYDRAVLHFVTSSYDQAINLLEPLVNDESTFGAKVLATGVASACYALNDPPDHMRSVELIEKMGDSGTLGQMDRSILLKKTTVLERESKHLLGYELLYIFGHFKCYSPVFAEGDQRELCLNVLSSKLVEIQKIGAVLGDVESFDASTLVDEEVQVQLEEKIACLLLSGGILALMGDLEPAKKSLDDLLFLYANHEIKHFLRKQKDPYAPPWAMYELAAVHLRKGEKELAKKLLQKAQSLCQNTKNPFSFSHMLNYKCAGALREC
mmetsp:Transcript_36520/g.58880  ORF Transcript_36520/g.58880 Transcript_36520/m.58880 type:complete len:574 (+) Transcript_36520:114-1835(+)